MAITCKAAITNGEGGYSIEEIQVGDPVQGEVLVAMRAAGICHTDFDSLNWGRHMVLGHEGAGIVLKTGPGVTHVKEGDNVLLNWAIPCGECFQCSIGNEHICENNSPVTGSPEEFNKGHAHKLGTLLNGEPVARSFHLGTLSAYTLVKEAAVVKNTSATLSYPAAAIIGCGVMTGYGSVMNAAKMPRGATAVVLGTGGVGLNVIQACRIAGASRIIAIDVNPERLQMAIDFGATDTLPADKNDKGLKHASEAVRNLLGGRGADYAFECTAIPELGAAPLAMIRNAGTAIQVSGIEQEIVIDMNLFEWDKIYLNPLYGKCNPHRDFPEIVQHFEKGNLKLEELVTRTYTLEELNIAFGDMLAGKNAKGVIVFS